MTGMLRTDSGLDRVTLSQLTEQERYDHFDELQRRLSEVWDAMRLNHADESVIVIPSVTIDRAVPYPGSLLQAYEERYLFLLLLLRQPRLRMTYVTSMPIAPGIVDYYLALLPGVIPSHAKARLTLVSVNDSSSLSLSEKLLARPRLLARIASGIPNPRRCHIVPYTTTTLERDVAISLGVPMYGADPRLAELGTKTGCRRLFAEVGVPHPLGAENVRSVDEVVEAIVEMRTKRPALVEVIVKHDEGVSGAGNALVDLRGIPPSDDAGERAAVRERVLDMQRESRTTSLDVYLSKLAEGGIVEERIVAQELRSPSVQLRITPDCRVELLSTHDQLLGGRSGQSYLGCVFPAEVAYARTISRHAAAIADRLVGLGVLGRFAVDFVVARQPDDTWSAYAIELNLRRGGTTHPFLTLQFLTDGHYKPDTALFVTATGEEKHLVATDHLESPRMRALSIDDLFDVVARHGLHFHQGRQTGVVFHMISSLTEHARIGLTAVGNSRAEASALYERAQRVLLDEADAALVEPALRL
jgi:PGM1 C-terminal domain